MSENNAVQNRGVGFIEIPLGTEAHRYAEEFAAEQSNPQKGKQVYLNTLAVYAVHRYLDWINIETDLNQSDSWQTGTRTLFDVADLVLPGVGKLECRPVLPSEELIHLPEEVRRDRIGYIAVQFSEQLDYVKLLGLVYSDPSIEVVEKIRLVELRSLDRIIDHVSWLLSGKLVRLRLWLEQCYELGWREPIELISMTRFKGASTSKTRFKGARSSEQSVSRAKQIGHAFNDQPLALLVQLSSTSTEDFSIRVRLCPTVKSLTDDLPNGIQLLVLDERGKVCMQKQVDEAASWVEHELTGKPGEKFSVQVVLGDTCVSEAFVI